MSTNLHKNLPVGVQDFESLIRDGYLYVDKTEQIWRLTHSGRHYFLARPRRFGKSLLLSTIEAYFEGKKELFDGLYLQQQEHDWINYPIFHIDLSPENYSSVEVLQNRLDWFLTQWEKQYGADDTSYSLSTRFENCIMRAVQQTGNRAIVLIDEYDKPILSAIGNPDLQNELRAILKAFYGVLKSQDGNIRFSLLTGVTKFSKVSIFSDLNNLNDISRDKRYYDICGISQSELETVLQPYIQAFADSNDCSVDETNDAFRRMYDGYRFTSSKQQNIYNPFSVLSALDRGEYGNYWFETGTPNYIVELLKRNNYTLSDMTTKPVDSTTLDSKDDNGQSIVPLLFQSGYLTIRDYKSENDLYYMDFPNDEVRSGFFRYILPYYTSVKKEESAFAIGQFVEELRAGQPEAFLTRLQAFFADFQYDAQTTPESHFRNVLFILCRLLGMQVDAEYMTSDGRIDLLIRTNDYIYIIECKLDASAKIALRQIERKDYPLPWSVDKRTIFLIGLNFSSKTRRLEDWEIGQKVVKENGQKGGQRKSPKGGHRGGQRTEEVFELIKANPSITREQLSEILHIVPSAVQKHINKLKIDRIRRIKGKQKGHWEIINKD